MRTIHQTDWNIRITAQNILKMGINNTVRWHQNFLRARRSNPARRLLGSLSNEDGDGDGDGNEKGKKSNTLKTLPRLFVHFFAVAARFVEYVNTSQRLFLTFPGLWYSLRIQLQKICQHLTNWTSWNKCDEVWGSANSLFKWRFRSHRRRCCLSSLMHEKERMDKLEEDWNGLQLWFLETR